MFLDTYATDSLHPDLAREALANYSPTVFEARIRDSSNHFLLAGRAAHFVAFSKCNLSLKPFVPPLSGGVELVRLYVQRHSRRAGIGAGLLARAEAHAKVAGGAFLWLAAWLDNANARAFYWAQGYKEVGTTSYVFEGQTYENSIYIKVLRTEL